MSQNNIEIYFEELLSAIDACFEDRRILPGLLLLYASIDIAASLDRPQSQPEVQGKDFVAWADKYLLPGSGLNCTAEDLYAARCGLLHSYTAEARNTRLGKAKMIFYAWGTADVGLLQGQLQQTGLRSRAVTVHVNTLFDALRAGLHRFLESLPQNPQWAQVVYGRAGKYFANIPQKSFGDQPA